MVGFRPVPFLGAELMVRMIGREFSVNDAAARRELGYVGPRCSGSGSSLGVAEAWGVGADGGVFDT